MKQHKINQAIRSIGLALNASNGCVATDVPGVPTDETHWKIDNTKEIQMLSELSEYLKTINTDSDPGCGGHNRNPSTTN